MWIDWLGGKNPVPDKWVEFELRSGHKYAAMSDTLDWTHIPDQEESDIIKYKEYSDD